MSYLYQVKTQCRLSAPTLHWVTKSDFALSYRLVQQASYRNACAYARSRAPSNQQAVNWRSPIPGLVSDGRRLFATYLQPDGQGGGLTYLTLCTLAGRFGSVPQNSLCFKLLVWFLWASDVSSTLPNSYALSLGFIVCGKRDNGGGTDMQRHSVCTRNPPCIAL